MKDPVFDICEKMLRNSPESSFKRLNPSLRSTLENCITADLPFQPNTFQRIYDKLRGSWWFGDGAGSSIGEGFYTTACECNHVSAQQSFERFAGRPGCLWEEDGKIPKRLHIGARFTWQGCFVTVTSMRTDRLIACTYKGQVSRIQGVSVGATVGYDPEYLIVASNKDGSAYNLRVVKTKQSTGERDIARRFTILYSEIAETRRMAKAKLKAILAKIAQCHPYHDADALTKEINAAHFRHFELEAIREAFKERRAFIADQDKIGSWREGHAGPFLDVEETLIRIKGDRVECSNGNSVGIVAVRALLPIAQEMRKSGSPSTLHLDLDGHAMTRVDNEAVTVGCTNIPWHEIDRITPQLI